VPTAATTRLDLLKDSVYLYTKEVYLWNEVIPSYQQFNPRRFSGADELTTAVNEMNGIKALQPLDRFSFVMTEEESDGLQSGEDKDFGFFIKAAAVDKSAPTDSIYWFVTYAYKNSTAGKAGVDRGWRVNKVNGSKLDYTDNSLSVLNNIFFGDINQASFEFIKPDGTSSSTLNLSKSSFTSNSVLYKDVKVAGGRKVGYLVFNQFFGEPSRIELQDAFSYFQSQEINELVVDLRYNPGGSTDTQDELANLIAPTSANGKVMYKYIFNKTLQSNQHQLIRKKLGLENVFSESENSQFFQKKGSLNLGRVFFIVTGSSASASELLINNLKPYMDVKLIGDTTYGKPVGFFPIPLYDFALYPISFKTVNSTGNADYYKGFAPDALVSDGVNRSWGDVSEPSLAAALQYINGNGFRSAARAKNSSNVSNDAQQQLQPLQHRLEENKFIGMFREK
jgi:C-terminal processing protease CtpA/Prc